jgi:hypothetical protein
LKVDEVEVQVGVEDQTGLKRWKVLRKLREYQLKWTTTRCIVSPGVSQADSATVGFRRGHPIGIPKWELLNPTPPSSHTQGQLRKLITPTLYGRRYLSPSLTKPITTRTSRQASSPLALLLNSYPRCRLRIREFTFNPLNFSILINHFSRAEKMES